MRLNIFKRFTSTALAILSVISICPVSLLEITASAKTSDYYTFTVLNGEATITDVDDSISGDITIPPSLGNGIVTSIGNRAFAGCTGLTNVTIPDSVKSIDEFAFSGCTNLTGIAIPDSIISIGSYAFFDCSGLKKVNITDLTAWCKISFDYYFSNPILFAKKLYLNGELITDLVIPDGVESIGSFAFKDCTALTSVTIPDSVISIGESAFSRCTSLTSVAIPEGVTSIGKSSFSHCTDLTSIAIPGSVTDIGEFAFGFCNGLKTATIGDSSASAENSVTSLGSNAFFNCSELENVIIDNSVANIERDAFEHCTGLKTVTIGNGVTNIGNDAFNFCSGLERVNISDLASWCNISFGNESSNPLCYAKKLYLNGKLIKDLVIPDGVESIESYAFRGCSSLTSVTIPDSVKSIGKDAFKVCNGMERINITDIAAWCNISFGNKYSNPLIQARELYLNNELITDLVIPDGVESIKGYAFNYYWELTSVTIPDSVTSIGNNAFSFCLEIKSVIIGNGVKSIGDSAFHGCTKLENAIIGNSVKSIGTEAFNSCTGLKEVNITDLASWCNISFGDYFSNPLQYAKKLYLNGKLITDLVIPDGVTSINDSAFYGCSAIASLTIPDSVTDIGIYAFYGCNNITDVYYAEDEKAWGEIEIQAYNESLENAERHYNSRWIVKTEISSMPTKLFYKLNEAFDVNGGKLALIYNDRTEVYTDMTADMLSGYNSKEYGEQKITVAYEKCAEEFTVEVYKQGDLDGDLLIGATDITLLKKCLLSVINGNTKFDVNGDETTDIRDLISLKKLSAE